MSNWEKMTFIVSFLFSALLLIESTAGRCQLQATVRTETNPGERPEMVYQTQLQLLCSNMSCPMTSFTACDTYTDLGIPRDCMDEEDCSRIFNLCGSIRTNIHQDQSAELPTAPNPQAKTDPVMMKPNNTCPTNISCTPIMITSCTTTTTVSPNSTVSTIEQSCFNVTSTVLSTITKTQEMTLIITHTTTPTPWTTQCPQTTTKLMTTTSINESEVSENMPCTPITSTKLIATTVLLPPQSSVPTQGNGSSSTTSALGALLGLSLVLLALVSIGWVWTCWTARKRGEVNINSKINNFPNTPGTVTINNNTDTLRRVQNPLYEETTINGGILALSEAEIETGRGENEETGPTYEIIPLPAPVVKKVSKKRGSIQLERKETATASVGGRVSVGVVSIMNDDSTQDNNIGAVGGGNNMNPYYLPDENTNGEESERSGDRDQENDYHLLGDEEEEKEERARENVYQVVVNPMDTEEDYADPDEEEMNNIYHVLEGPTPKEEEEEEEESEGEKDEREKTTEGEEEERERDKVEVEEPLTEPAAYEIPLVSSSKHNSTVLQ